MLAKLSINSKKNCLFKIIITLYKIEFNFLSNIKKSEKNNNKKN